MKKNMKICQKCEEFKAIYQGTFCLSEYFQSNDDISFEIRPPPTSCPYKLEHIVLTDEKDAN